jgi:hypothetical protein
VRNPLIDCLFKSTLIEALHLPPLFGPLSCHCHLSLLSCPAFQLPMSLLGCLGESKEGEVAC